jgi:TPP-dependent pyruvate/acetoin dehydrogenase alpha subunit
MGPMPPPTAPPDVLLGLYHSMVRTRCFEETVYNLFVTETMQGTVHLSTGQEAVSTGVCAALRREDYLVPSFRGHGEFLAKGGSPRSAMAEIFAKATGCGMGLSGSMHLGDPQLHIVPGMAIVGAGIPIAAGLALGARMQGGDQVAAVFFGDGAANCGYFHEGLNLAAIWRLPVVFVCVNNQYAVSTPYRRTTAVATIAERASAYSIDGRRVDGNNVLAVYAAATEAIDHARSGAGPTLLECLTYRHRGHSRFDPARYRPEGELDIWLKTDPLPGFELKLRELGAASAQTIAETRRAVEAEIAEAVEFARRSPAPAADAALSIVFSTAEAQVPPSSFPLGGAARPS